MQNTDWCTSMCLHRAKACTALVHACNWRSATSSTASAILTRPIYGLLAQRAHSNSMSRNPQNLSVLHIRVSFCQHAAQLLQSCTADHTCMPPDCSMCDAHEKLVWVWLCLDSCLGKLAGPLSSRPAAGSCTKDSLVCNLQQLQQHWMNHVVDTVRDLPPGTGLPQAHASLDLTAVHIQDGLSKH